MFYLHAVAAQMERKLCIMPGCLWDAQLREPCYFCLQCLRTTDLCDCFSCFLHGEICRVDDAQAIPAQVWGAVRFPSLLWVFHWFRNYTLMVNEIRGCTRVHTSTRAVSSVKPMVLKWASAALQLQRPHQLLNTSASLSDRNSIYQCFFLHSTFHLQLTRPIFFLIYISRYCLSRACAARQNKTRTIKNLIFPKADSCWRGS